MTYDKEFKEEALRLSDEIGLRKAAAQLGIPYYTLSNWRCKRNMYGEQAHVGSGHERVPLDPQEQRIRELEKEVAELQRANDILKDALGFFAVPQQPFRIYIRVPHRRKRDIYNARWVLAFRPLRWATNAHAVGLPFAGERRKFLKKG